MAEKNYYAFFDKPTPQNFEANQQGSLTPEQQSALERTVKEKRGTVIFFVVAIFALFLFMLFFLGRLGGGNVTSSPYDSIVSVGLFAVGLLLFALFLVGDMSILFIGDDIENGSVESVIGKIVWKMGGYRVVSEDRKLRSLWRGRVLPPPGDYRFYCLPNSGLVIMAEEMGLVSTSQPKELVFDALAQANHFSAEDLNKNRQGSLSGMQELRLYGYAFLLGVVSIVGPLFFIFSTSIIMSVQNQAAGGGWVIYIILALLTLAVLFSAGWKSVLVLRDIWDGKAEHMDGQVMWHMHRSRNSYYYTYQLNGIKFNVSKVAYNALIEGKEYRIYFTPRSKRLVAIEPK